MYIKYPLAPSILYCCMVLLSLPSIFVRSHCGTHRRSLRNTLLISTRPAAVALLVWTATSTTLSLVAEGAPLSLAPRGVPNVNAAPGGDAPLDFVTHKRASKTSASPTAANPHLNSDASSSASGPAHQTTPAPSSKQLHQNKATGGSNIAGNEANSVAHEAPTAQGGLDDGRESSPSASASPSVASPSAQDHAGPSKGPLMWVLTSVAVVVAIGGIVVGTVVARRNRSKKEPARKGSFFVGFEDVHRLRQGKGKPWQVNPQSATAPGSPSVEREQFWNPLP